VKWSKFFMASIFIIGAFNAKLFANNDIDTSDAGSESISGPYQPHSSSKSPFSFSAFTDVMGKAKINKGLFKKDKVQFAITNAEAAAVFYYCPKFSEAASATLGYTNTYFDWDGNPHFNQTHFDTITLSLSGMTKRFDRWLWRGQIDINYDGFEELKASYFSYNLIMWGRYSFCQAVGLHMGFYIETGMRMDRIYPILGFDWQINSKWRLNAVFPFNMALEYAYADHWTFALAGRTFSSRHRIQPDYFGDSELFRYTNFGLEAMVKYTLGDIVANLHTGVTTGGRFKIANASNHHPDHYNLDPTGYIGGELDMRF